MPRRVFLFQVFCHIVVYERRQDLDNTDHFVFIDYEPERHSCENIFVIVDTDLIRLWEIEDN